MLPTPFGGCKMALKCCELLDEVLNRVEVGLPPNGVKRDGFHPSSHHIGDGGHILCDQHHGCTVRAL